MELGNLTDCEKLAVFESSYSDGFISFSFVYLFIVFAILVTSLIWWTFRRKVLYLKRRNFSLLLLMSLGFLCNLITGPLYRYISALSVKNGNYVQGGIYWCGFGNFIYFMTFPALAGPQIIRLELFRRNVLYNTKVAEVIQKRTSTYSAPKISAETISEIQHAKYKASSKYGMLLGFICFLVSAFLSLVYVLLTCPIINANSNASSYCPRRRSEYNQDAVYSVSLILLVILMFAMFYYYVSRKAQGTPDPFGILREIRFSYMVPISLGALGLILNMIDPGEITQNLPRKWTWWVLTDFGVLSLLLFSLPYQILKSYDVKYSKVGRSLTLHELLESKTGAVLFENHLISEFSVENLSFWKMINWWKGKYDSTPRDVRKLEAQNIYNRWIAHGSLLQVNVSHETAATIEAWLSSGDLIPQKMFDEAQKEIFKLMATDSFPRFKKQRIFKEYIGDEDLRTSAATSSIKENNSSNFLIIDPEMDI